MLIDFLYKKTTQRLWCHRQATFDLTKHDRMQSRWRTRYAGYSFSFSLINWSSAPLVGAASVSSSVTPSPFSPPTLEVLPDMSSIPSTSDCSIASSPMSPQIHQTQNLQDVSTGGKYMVSHRQQDALCCSPIWNHT